jgi:hypothetical protein
MECSPRPVEWRYLRRPHELLKCQRSQGENAGQDLIERSNLNLNEVRLRVSFLLPGLEIAFSRELFLLTLAGSGVLPGPAEPPVQLYVTEPSPLRIPGTSRLTSSPAGHVSITRPGGSSRHDGASCRLQPAQIHIVPAAGAG